MADNCSKGNIGSGGATLYSFKFYSADSMDPLEYANLASLVDRVAFGKIFPFVSPVAVNSNTLDLLSERTITQIKEQLGVSASSFPNQNGIRDFLNGRRMFRPELMVRLIDMLDFWDEIVRYKINCGELSMSNFSLIENLNNRERLVRSQLEKIVKYLVKEHIPGELNIWGMTTEKSMQELLRRTSDDLLVRKFADTLNPFVRTLALGLADSDFDLNGQLVEEAIVPILMVDKNNNGVIKFENQHPLDRFGSEACTRRRFCRQKIRR